MRRLLLSISAGALTLGLLAAPSASAQQSVNLFVGGFTPRAVDARTDGDVLVRNLNFLAFDTGDFKGATVGGEWLVALGDNLDAGLGIGFYQRTVPTVYSNFVNANGSEIENDLKLRIVPFTATIRFLPLGHQAAIQPYVGAGVGVFAWRYSETGEFVDFTDPNRAIFRGSFKGSGSNAGPMILGGVRFPIGATDVGGEIRYQSAEGTLPADQDFAGTKIDLGGFNYLVTFNIRF